MGQKTVVYCGKGGQLVVAGAAYKQGLLGISHSAKDLEEVEGERGEQLVLSRKLGWASCLSWIFSGSLGAQN